jgi:hypothetical protein
MNADVTTLLFGLFTNQRIQTAPLAHRQELLTNVFPVLAAVR